ncbi:YeeE/YedE family protein [Solitalea koreensis]|uniref:Uncharacterized protein n=1 Tax=Solitalea koreensis TaxID=543615 RepID=A0A521D2S0_9SPHI|nr:YeeE/YedE thiosulfate transporter family protein [Solitalea koreensis]SMO65989.1 hypothetical protein SAMN06265350_105214 [Solitalea koreensis]
MLEIIRQPWPWYVSGTLIALIMALLLFFGKSFGFSSNLRTICTACGAGKKVDFFDFDWKSQHWNLLFLVGSVMGGVISMLFLQTNEPLKLSAATIHDLKNLGIIFDGQINPKQVFSFDFLMSIKGITVLLGGGFLVGFGSRYAGGCTSGHAISGLSNFQTPSLLAVAGFFTGGLIMTHLLMPFIF